MKNMKNMKKIVSVLLTLAMLATMASSVLATSDKGGTSTNKPTISSPNMSDYGGNAVGLILGAIQWIGYAFAIGMLIYIGIKYTMSAANEKADLKKGLINYVIGAVIIAGAATICGWVVSFGESELAK